MAQSNITKKPFSATELENWQEFISLLRSMVEVTNMPDAQRPGFLKLHPGDSTLRFFLTSPEVTRNDFSQWLAALEKHFCYPQLTELQIIKLVKLEFDPEVQYLEELLVEIRTFTLPAYPNPILEPVPQANLPNEQAENDRAANENAANDQRQRFADLEREGKIWKFFKRAMPNWIQVEIFDKHKTMKRQYLCTLARRCSVFNQLCRTDHWSTNTFNEVQPNLTK